MTALRTQIAIAIVAAGSMAAGCAPAASPPPAGTVTQVFSINAMVAGVVAGAGDTIQGGQHVITNNTGTLEFTVGTKLDCFQDISTNVIVAPSSTLLLQYVSGPVTCGTKNGPPATVKAGHTLIHLADPVFTVVRGRHQTTIRVAYGSVVISATDLEGRAIANGRAVVSAGHQVVIVDGQAPGPIIAFAIDQLSAFEQQAIKSLTPQEPPSTPPTSPSTPPTSPSTPPTSPLPQTITFTSTAPRDAKPGGIYAVMAKGGESGNPVIFTIASSSAKICSISGNTVAFNQRGTCVIDANQAGNAQYQAAPQMLQTVIIL